MHAWEQVANVTFQLVTDTSKANIDIGWRDYSSYSQLGETEYGSYNISPSRAMFIDGVFVDFKDPSVRAVGTDQTSTYSASTATLYQVMMHELGHALGLAHSSNRGALMYAYLGQSNNAITTSTGERDSIVASQHDLVLEQANLFEHLTQQVADTAVYRFFNTGDGSHFFTSNATESAAIVQNRPDMVAEGVSFYAPTV